MPTVRRSTQQLMKLGGAPVLYLLSATTGNWFLHCFSLSTSTINILGGVYQTLFGHFEQLKSPDWLKLSNCTTKINNSVTCVRRNSNMASLTTNELTMPCQVIDLIEKMEQEQILASASNIN